MDRCSICSPHAVSSCLSGTTVSFNSRACPCLSSKSFGASLKTQTRGRDAPLRKMVRANGQRSAERTISPSRSLARRRELRSAGTARAISCPADAPCTCSNMPTGIPLPRNKIFYATAQRSRHGQIRLGLPSNREHTPSTFTDCAVEVLSRCAAQSRTGHDINNQRARRRQSQGAAKVSQTPLKIHLPKTV